MDKIHYQELDKLFNWDQLFSVNPHDIKWALTSAFEVRTDWHKVYDGDWDVKLPIEEDFVHSSVSDMITKNIPFTETSLYLYSAKKIKEGFNRWSCTNVEDFKKRGEHILKTYEKIKNEGFKTQEELNSNKEYSLKVNGKFVDDPGVCIDRDGRYLYHNGNHRLPMFKHLNIPEIKIKVNARHKEWVDFLLYVKKISERVWGENKIYQPVNHTDFTNYDVEWGNYRLNLLCEHIKNYNQSVLDIGALWGHFSCGLAKKGMQCTAVESNKDFSYIMKKLMIAQDLDFTIIHDNIFNIKSFDYDIILALNIFHHFLKSEKTYEQLKSLLNQLSMKEMYFQVHRPEEEQMKNAFKNFNNEEFIQFIIDNSCLNNFIEIGEEEGRKIYKIWR